MYYCCTELHPFWLEFMHLRLSPLRKRWKRVVKLTFARRKKDDLRRPIGVVRWSAMLQIGSFVLVILKHWTPLPDWSAERLNIQRRNGRRMGG